MYQTELRACAKAEGLTARGWQYAVRPVVPRPSYSRRLLLWLPATVRSAHLEGCRDGDELHTTSWRGLSPSSEVLRSGLCAWRAVGEPSVGESPRPAPHCGPQTEPAALNGSTQGVCGIVSRTAAILAAALPTLLQHPQCCWDQGPLCCPLASSCCLEDVRRSISIRTAMVRGHYPSARWQCPRLPPIFTGWFSPTRGWDGWLRTSGLNLASDSDSSDGTMRFPPCKTKSMLALRRQRSWAR